MPSTVTLTNSQRRLAFAMSQLSSLLAFTAMELHQRGIVFAFWSRRVSSLKASGIARRWYWTSTYRWHADFRVLQVKHARLVRLSFLSLGVVSEPPSVLVTLSASMASDIDFGIGIDCAR